jgi:hypothetical protein
LLPVAESVRQPGGCILVEQVMYSGEYSAALPRHVNDGPFAEGR